MFPTPDHDAKLERILHRALRDLPSRHAPRSLEQRVLAEIERRAALPWWRKSFAHWPLAARAGFILASAGFIKLALMLGVWVMAGFDGAQFKTAFAPQFAWFDNAVVVVNAIAGFFEILFRNIPPLWLYGSLIFFASMYVMLFGLGAAAYKALRAQPHN